MKEKIRLPASFYLRGLEYLPYTVPFKYEGITPEQGTVKCQLIDHSVGAASAHTDIDLLKFLALKNALHIQIEDKIPESEVDTEQWDEVLFHSARVGQIVLQAISIDGGYILSESELKEVCKNYAPKNVKNEFLYRDENFCIIRTWFYTSLGGWFSGVAAANSLEIAAQLALFRAVLSFFAFSECVTGDIEIMFLNPEMKSKFPDLKENKRNSMKEDDLRNHIISTYMFRRNPMSINKILIKFPGWIEDVNLRILNEKDSAEFTEDDRKLKAAYSRRLQPK